MTVRLARISSVVGLAVWFGLESYRQAVLDPVIGGQGVPPEILDVVQRPLLVGSIAVLVYAYALSMADESPGTDRALQLAILAQWAAPMFFAADVASDGISTFSYLGLVSLVLAVLAAIGVLVPAVRST